ncbi:PAS domain S-box protein [Methylobacterium sp. J-088]|uniref:PAS domain-containing protein n=1 Tax=Methylobacterium sp. J-088 TaxID=2836664 RepID=UPI001FBAA818|nr:PAS domain S-box protein [Methylobacterium sp. J-088]MCJ2066955.1 PAS domain S-box protein [Methylobacterium sp. J-088]
MTHPPLPPIPHGAASTTTGSGSALASLVAAIGDAVVVADPEGLITVWNPAAERIFGYSATEALGQTLDLITPERHRRRHWDGYAKTMRTGTTRYGAETLRVPAIRKDGSQLSIAFTVGMVRDAADRVTGIVAVIRDETERWSEEKRLRQRVAELEATVPA